MRSLQIRGAFAILGMGATFAITIVSAASVSGVARISPDEAMARALNELAPTPDGYVLRHPAHTVEFADGGITVTPRRGPEWQWSLAGVSAGRSECRIVPGPVGPTSPGALEVTDERGPVREQYLVGVRSVEQRFVIDQPLALQGEDLVIDGRVSCDASLERSDQGWVWRNDEGVITLADVHVYDADGHTLAAAMAVNPASTQIVVDGLALAGASYPVTIDPEIGTNDFRISDMGTDGDFDWDGQECAVAYNATNNQYLVVWEGDDDSGTLIDGEYEIFGQRIDASTGGAVGANDFRISDMGVNGVGTADAVAPSVAWNSASNEYLVVWSGDDATGTLVDGEYEIFGQRLAGATGAEVGTNDFRISDMGPDADPLFDAADPSVAYNATLNEYLVVWTGDDVTDEESEIYGQRIAGATGAAVGTNDFRISDMGTDGDPLFDALSPKVVYAPTRGEYLVVWQGDDNSGVLVNGEFEIWGQRITGATGAEVGTNDFRISDMGPDGNSAYDAQEPALAWASGDNRYLVVWSGDDDAGGVVEGEREIFGQMIDGTTGGQIGVNDFRISDMGPDSDPLFDALAPSVAYNPVGHQLLVVWAGDDKGGGLDDGEFEIFGQLIDATSGAEAGSNDFVMTDTGTPGLTTVGAFLPEVAARTSGTVEYLVGWHADTDLNGLSEGEFEIYGQRLRSDGNETGTDDFRISDMGRDGDIDWDARQADAVYNPDENEYLVVWEGDDNVGTLVDGETEIFGQRIDAATGSEVGINDFRISDMGPDGDPAFDAQKPAVAYNRVAHEYLVVWSGEDDTGTLVAGEFEIFGQRLAGATGAEVGTNDFRISDMGPDGSDLYAAFNPAVAFSVTSNEYLVVWEGDDLGGGLVEGEFEIFGQRLSGGTAAPLGANDFRISDIGPNGIIDYSAVVPAIVWNSVENEYLVVFAGEDNAGVLVPGEFEIYGQLLDASGAEIGTNDFRISTAGNDGDDTYDAFNPAVAFNSTADEYLVVWDGEDLGALLGPGEKEIFGQRLSGAGVQIGTDDFRISDMGPNADPFYDAQSPSVDYNSAADEYLVIWEGDDDTPPYVDGESEIWAQRLAGATGTEVGDNDFRLSDMGVDGDPLSDATDPVAVSSGSDLVLVLWRGDDDNGVFGPDEFEIFGQVFSFGTGTSGIDESTRPVDLVLSISPNPVRTTGRIDFSAPTTGPVEFTLVDIAGRVRWSQVVRVDAPGRVSLALDAVDLPKGAYFVRAAAHGATSTRKVIVAR